MNDNPKTPRKTRKDKLSPTLRALNVVIAAIDGLPVDDKRKVMASALLWCGITEPGMTQPTGEPVAKVEIGV